MIFKMINLNYTFIEMSRRDETLLTVGFNLRNILHNVTPQSRRDDTIIASKLRPCGTSEREAYNCRRLKPTVSKVLSLRDIILINKLKTEN